MASITYTDKVQLTPNPNPDINQWRAADANEVKTVVNVKADIASPTFTGTPAAPTAALGTDTTQIATTEFVQDALNANIVSITGATSLDATAYGKVHVCTGTSSNYTVDLPTAVGNTGGSLIIKGAVALTKVVTIAGSSGQTIDGESDREIGSTGMITLMSDGANWVVSNEVGSWIPYTPVFAGFSSDPTVDRAMFFRVGKICTVILHQSANGTSNATTKTITLPFNADSTATQPGYIGPLINNGAAPTTPGIMISRVGSNIADVYRDFTNLAWTATGGCRFNFIYTYKIA